MKRTLLLLIAAAVLVHAAEPDWKQAKVMTLALHRTPPLHATDPPATPEIASVDVQLVRSSTGTAVRLRWKDATPDRAELPQAQRAWQSESLVTQSQATDRFFDACAVMVPAKPVQSDLFPSLQMGDQAHPVIIYFHDVTRGPAIMEASGRGTTKRTGKKFPSQAAWEAGVWTVVLELPPLPPAAPFSVAVWNGKQQDRDGRKYFTIWQPAP